MVSLSSSAQATTTVNRIISRQHFREAISKWTKFQQSGNPACCCWVLAASWSSRMLRYIKIRSGGGCSVVIVREIPVAVGEVDRCVLVAEIDAELGLITCVWDRIGQMARHSTPRRSGTGGSSDSSQWCRWCGKSRQRTGWWRESRRKRTNTEQSRETWLKMEWCWDTHNTWQSWATRAVITCEVRTRRMRVCVRALRCSVSPPRRVHACCYWLSAKSFK